MRCREMFAVPGIIVFFYFNFFRYVFVLIKENVTKASLCPHCRHQNQAETQGSCTQDADVWRMTPQDRCPVHLWSLLFLRRPMILHGSVLHGSVLRCQSHVNPWSATNRKIISKFIIIMQATISCVEFINNSIGSRMKCNNNNNVTDPPTEQKQSI